MKKSNLIKVVTILLISLIVMLFATTVNAADDEQFKNQTDDFMEQYLNGSKNNTPANNTPANNTPKNNTPANNTPKNNTPVNSSVYNNNANSNLPQTGIEDSIPVAILVVVFGISAVYAYKKVNDYKNI